MKTFLCSTFATVLAVSWPVVAQIASPPARQVQPSAQETNVVHDGIVYYRGGTYLIRNGRAAAVDAILIPEGQVLIPDGRRVPLPENILTNPSPTVTDGLFSVRGQAYLIRNGKTTLVDAKLIPDGKVLTADNQLLPLPSDFSGFVLDRAPDGTVLPTPPSQSGPQVLSGQAGVPQVPSPVQPQSAQQGVTKPNASSGASAPAQPGVNPPTPPASR